MTRPDASDDHAPMGGLAQHFLLVDRSTEVHCPRRFDRRGRPVLVEALFVEWILSAAVAPGRVIEVAPLTTFVGGSALLTEVGRGGGLPRT